MADYEQMEFDVRLESDRCLQENVNLAIDFACKQVQQPLFRKRSLAIYCIRSDCRQHCACFPRGKPRGFVAGIPDAVQRIQHDRYKIR